MKFKLFLISAITIFTFSFFSPSFCSDSVSLYVGEKINLNEYIKEYFDGDELNWESGNIGIAEIDSSGNITGKSVGTTTVIVTEGKSLNVKSKLIEVKVSASAKELKIKDSSIEIYPGEYYYIDYSIVTFDGKETKPENSIKWYSNNSSIAKVDSSGKITGLMSGKVTIKGQTIYGDKEAEIDVFVKKSSSKLSINKNAPSVKLKAGETTTLIPTIDGNDVSSRVIWSSDNISIAKIDANGKLSALRPGKVRITGIIGSGILRDYIDIYISTMIKDIKFGTNKITLENIGESYQLDYEIIPLDPKNPPLVNDINWYSSNDKIVSVSKSGEITALSNGVVRISGITVDGGKGDACTVKVESNETPEREIFVTKVEFDSVPENGLVGEKIPLSYNVYPENATNKNIRISVNEGSPNQIQLIDGIFYYIPSETGSMELLIRNDSNTTDTAKIRIESPLKDLDIEPASLEYKRNKYQMFMGEEVKLNFILKMKSPYSDYDVYHSNFIVESDNDSIVKVDESGSEFILKALKGGNVKITAKTKDNRFDDSISIYVKSPIKNAYSDRKVILPLNIPYRPNFYPEFISYMNYPFDSIDLTDFYKVIITNQYIKEDYVDQEIEFEKSLLTSQMESRKDRLNSLISIKKTARNGYCQFLGNRNLTDRSGDLIQIAKVVDGNKIIGHFDGKVDIKLSSAYSNLDASTSIEFTSDNTLFTTITNESKLQTYDSILENLGYKNLIGLKTPSENIKLAINCHSRFSGKLAKDIPSEKYVEDILALESLEIIPDSMKKNYSNYLTREDLAELSLKLYEFYSKEEVVKEDDFRFLDTKNLLVKTAAKLKLIEPVERDYFHPSLSAKKSELYDVINKVAELTGTRALDSSMVENLSGSSENLTKEEAIGLLNEAIK